MFNSKREAGPWRKGINALPVPRALIMGMHGAEGRARLAWCEPTTWRRGLCQSRVC